MDEDSYDEDFSDEYESNKNEVLLILFQSFELYLFSFLSLTC